MLYHSHLLVNVGDNPDRPDWNICRRWLRNLYRVHQRLAMAFPSSPPASEDWPAREKAYCAPFSPTGFPALRDLPANNAPDVPDDDDVPVVQVHVPRNGHAGFLFRIDHPPDPLGGAGRRPVIVVQSAEPPDWDYAFGLTPGAHDDRGRPVGNAGYLLAAPPQVKEVSISLDGDALALCSEKQNYRILPGQRLRFRLRANPTVKRDGQRHRLRIPQEAFDAGPEERARAFFQVHKDWLARKFGPAAADLLLCPPHQHHDREPAPDARDDRTVEDGLVTGWAYAWRTKHEPQPKQRMQFWSVLFEGSLVLQDPDALVAALAAGIGPAKGFGFGLLSVAPAG